jgi:AcrR family transcriptional regulator
MVDVARISRKDSQMVTRERLRGAAGHHFARHGYSGARIETIAEAAGYSKGAFYSNYTSKLDLLIDLLREKQIGEVQLWQEVIAHSVDVEADLAHLTARYDNLPHIRERMLLNVELQLEADRNPEFRPIFCEYLDNLYVEMRCFFVIMLAQRGKAPPENLDHILFTTRLLGLSLGSSSLLGNEMGRRLTPSKVMFEFLRGVIDAAPDLPTREE